MFIVRPSEPHTECEKKEVSLKLFPSFSQKGIYLEVFLMLTDAKQSYIVDFTASRIDAKTHFLNQHEFENHIAHHWMVTVGPI